MSASSQQAPVRPPRKIGRPRKDAAPIDRNCGYCLATFTRGHTERDLHYESCHPTHATPSTVQHKFPCDWCFPDSSFRNKASLTSHKTDRCREGNAHVEERNLLNQELDKRARRRDKRARRRERVRAPHAEAGGELSSSPGDWLPLDLGNEDDSYAESSASASIRDWPTHYWKGEEVTLMPDLFEGHRPEDRNDEKHEQSLRKGVPLSLRQARIYRRSQTGFEAQF